MVGSADLGKVRIGPTKTEGRDTDMIEAPKRAWWRRKGWRLLAAFWLLLPVLRVASWGPVTYATYRGWLPLWVPMDTVYRPLMPLLEWEPARSVLSPYLSPSYHLSVEHTHEEAERQGNGINRMHWAPPKSAEPTP